MATSIPGLNEFLTGYPGMHVKPRASKNVEVSGNFEFSASGFGKKAHDSFEILVQLDEKFPKTIPRVWETAGKSPRSGDYHVNPDGTLCLGSHLRLRRILTQEPRISAFAELCIVPYLLNVSIKLREGGDFITGELPHGTIGIVADYLNIFGLTEPQQVIGVLEALATKKRIANKKACPCGCSRRLGVCRLHNSINEYRHVAWRSWFRQHAAEIREKRYG